VKEENHGGAAEKVSSHPSGRFSGGGRGPLSALAATNGRLVTVQNEKTNTNRSHLDSAEADD
jgi:hypothetical protein